MTAAGCKITSNPIPEYLSTVDGRVNAVVRATISRIQARIKLSMAAAKHGREYKRGKNGTIVHQASAPGEAPAIDTGALTNSIQTEMLTRTSGMVYTNMEYAAVLEFGGGHIAPRPAWVPAAEAERAAFEAAMKKALEI